MIRRGRLKVGVDGRVLAIPGVRGWTRYASNLLRALSLREDVELIVFAREVPCAGHLDGVRARIVRFDAPRETLWNDWALPRRLREEGVDVFHALADRGLPCWKPCALVVTLHDSFERAHWRHLFSTPKRRLWYWKHELVNARLADVVVTVSDTTRADLLARRVCSPEKLTRVYLAPAGEFRPEADPGDAAVLRCYGLERPYVLYVGGYDPRKNVAALVDAFERAGLTDHELVIVAAQCPADAELRARFGARACASRLRLIEAAPAELPSLYRRAAFFVNPSLWESFSFQLVEAMASGLPIVTSRRAAMPEIVADAGLLFDPADADELAALMRRMAGDSDLRARLRARGLARAQAFDWGTVAAETVAVYRRAVGA